MDFNVKHTQKYLSLPWSFKVRCCWRKCEQSQNPELKSYLGVYHTQRSVWSLESPFFSSQEKKKILFDKDTEDKEEG